MLILLPVLLLLLAALILFTLQVLKVGYGAAWMTGVGITLITWAFVLAEHWILKESVISIDWGSVLPANYSLSLRMDAFTWPYMLALTSLILAVMLTAPARLPQKANPWAWAGSLAMTAAGLLAVMAGNVITLVLAWTILDIFELLIVLGSVSKERLTGESVVAFGMRVMGSLLVLWSMLFSQTDNQVLFGGVFYSQAAIVLLVGIGLRLGIIPLHLPYIDEIPLRRGLGTTMRLVPFASCLLFLGRLPSLNLSPIWNGIMIGFAALAIFYSAGLWLSAKDELSGRPYFLISMSGIGLACVLGGQSQATIAWGCGMILFGGLLFLYSTRRRSILFIPLLGLLGLSGLPFTLVASGWQGLTASQFPGLLVLIIIAYSMLLSGYFRHSIREDTTTPVGDRWIMGVYPAGLLLLVVSGLVLTIIGLPNSLSVDGWWASLITALLAGGISFIIWRWSTQAIQSETRFGWLLALGKRLGGLLSGFLSLQWIYRMVVFSYRVLQQIISFLTVILEGDGGILWALLLLVLLISITQLQTVITP